MAVTHEILKEYTVTRTPVQDIVLSGIPQNFTDLALFVSARSDGTNGTIAVYFNDDTTNSNYFSRRQYYTASFTTTSTFSAPWWMYGNTANLQDNHFSNSNLYIADYTSAVRKTVSGESQIAASTASQIQGFYSGGYWTGTSAINKISLRYQIDPLFQYGTTVRLYGIKNS